MNLEALHSSARFGTTVQENLTILMDLDYSALGATPKDVSKAVRHVCGLLLPGDDLKPLTTDDFEQSVQDYYAKFLRDDPTRRSAQIFLCYFSCFFHELRHVHDLLGSRSGQLLFYNAFRVIQNMPELLNMLWDWQEAHPGKRIPLPLAPSLDLVPDLPAGVRMLFTEWSKSAGIFKTFQAVERFSPGNLSLVHLLETSAINVQLDFVHDLLGQDAVLDLTNLIEEEGNAALYMQIRNEIEEAFAAANFEGVGGGTLLNYLIWVALNQTARYEDPEDMVAPVLYFQFLSEEIIYRIPTNRRLDIKQVQNMISEVCAEWGLINPEEVRRETNARLCARVERLRQARGADDPKGSAKFLESVIEQFNAIHDLAQTNPGFLGQREYAWALVFRNLPSVHVKIFVDGVAHDIMSLGRQGISADDWIECATWGGVLRLLSDGMGKTKPGFHEKICYEILRSATDGRPALNFYNPALSNF